LLRVCLAVSLLVASSLLVVACSDRAATEEPEAKPAPAAAPRLTSVPDLRGKTLKQVGKILGSQDVTVVVAFPSVDATARVAEDKVAGTVILAHAVNWHHVGKRMSLATASKKGPSHVVLSQSPAPGQPIAGLKAIELKTDEHPNNKTGFLWMTGHSDQVKSEGAQSCFECHEETNCSDCHTALP